MDLSGAALREELAAGARTLGAELAAQQIEQLLALAALLAMWSTRFNLTSIRAPHEVLTKHLLDSLSVHRYLHGQRIVDAGTGAGFPGLPLAVARPELDFLLIDSTAKKIRFVEEAIGELGLRNVRARAVRAEHLILEHPADTIVARAVAPLPRLIAEAGALLAPDGRLLAMKGRYPTAELAALPEGFRVESVERLNVPGLAEQRHLVVIVRR